MAGNILKAGHELAVYNRTPARARDLVTRGARQARSPAELATESDVVMACLLTPAVCEEIFLGANGVVAAAKPGTLLVDFSTNGPETAVRCHDAAKARQIGYLDAPVSGGPMGAQAATLAIMVGGDRRDFERANPLLDILGKNIHYLGPAGSGCAAKLANQVILGATLAVMCEAFVAAAKYGLDPAQLYQVLMGSTSGGRVMERNMGAKILKRDFHTQFSIDLMAKDLGLATTFGRQEGVRMVLGTMAELVVREAQATGYGGADIAALIRPLEQLAGAEVRPADGGPS